MELVVSLLIQHQDFQWLRQNQDFTLHLQQDNFCKICDMMLQWQKCGKKHIIGQILNSSLWHLCLFSTTVYTVDGSYSDHRESLPCSNPLLQPSELCSHLNLLTLMAHNTSAHEKELWSPCLVLVTFKCIIKHIKRNDGVQWLHNQFKEVSRTSEENFNFFFPICIVLLSLNILGNFSLSS